MSWKLEMMLSWVSVCTILWCCISAQGMSKRTIYTLFSDRKTWNEAKAICESQYGQLFKPERQADLEEIQHLDQYRWNRVIFSNLSNGEKIWSGVHSPFNNSTLEFQDCEVKQADIAVASTVPGGKCGAFENADWDLGVMNCTGTHMFICQREEGDCWFEPFPDKKPSTIDTFQSLAVGLSASNCAYECRSRNMSVHECWGFQYDPTQVIGCVLYFLSDSVAQSNGATSASVLYVVPTNLATLNGSIFYARRCFEGVQDNEVYSSFVNTDSSPNTNCSYHIYPGDSNDTTICYCPANTQPSIPEPISNEAKAEEYVKELTIDTSNTSAAHRKLNSAEDDRASAVGVGYVGVALMTTVFGGLFLMDVNVILAEIKKVFPNIRGETNTMTEEAPDSSEC